VIDVKVWASIDGVRIEAGPVVHNFTPEMAKRLATNLLEAAQSAERMKSSLQKLDPETKP
jgi:hypothetical protein